MRWEDLSPMEQQAAKRLREIMDERVANLTDKEKRWVEREIKKMDKRIAKRNKQQG